MLITTERAQQNIASITNFTAEELLRLEHMIAAVSEAVNKYCNRTFELANYDELYNGVQSSRLILRNHPIVAVERVLSGPTTVLEITNTSATNQQARVRTLEDRLRLTHVASGTTSVNELTYSSYATITALKTAVDAVASGWSASIPNTSYNNYPSTDLLPMQGNLGAKDRDAELRLHITEETNYEVDARKGWLIRGFNQTQDKIDEFQWEGGINAWRVVYTAGYEEIPADVQEATAIWTAAQWFANARDAGLQYESDFRGRAYNPYGFIPPMVIELLRPYRTRTITRLGG